MTGGDPGGGPVHGAGPWWFSGPRPDEGSGGARGPGPSAGFTLASLASGAQQVVELAKHAILVPHADHDDPSEHGACIICRGLLVLGDVRGRSDEDATGGQAARQAQASVDWIDLDPARPDARSPGRDPRL